MYTVRTTTARTFCFLFHKESRNNARTRMQWRGQLRTQIPGTNTSPHQEAARPMVPIAGLTGQRPSAPSP
eukprot:1349740-Alexandrium_andersonii.AAC.1